jgi:molecular chaperone GrpE
MTTMSSDDLSLGLEAMDRLIAAGFESARSTEAAERAHRQEIERLLRRFLDVIDSLGACAALSGHDAAPQAVLSTIGRIRQQALRVVGEFGVEPIEAIGKPVDLTHSEVLDVRADSDAPPDTVIEEIVRAYMWRGQLLRRARVIVSGGDAASAPASERSEGDLEGGRQ